MIRIRRKRAFLVKLLIVSGFFFMIGFYYHYHLPRIKQWLLVEAEEMSSKHSPVRMWPQDVELNLIPIGVTFKDIRLQPNKELKSQLVVNHLKELQVSLSFWGLLKGKLELGIIRLAGSDVKVFAKGRLPGDLPEKKITEETTKAIKGIDFDFATLDLIPINEVAFEDIALWAKSTEGSMSLHSPAVNFSVEKKQQSVRISLQSKNLKIKRTEDPAIFKSNLDIRLQVDKDEITVTRLKVQKEDSFLLASGWVEWTPKTLDVSRIVGRARTNLYMPDVELLLKELKLVDNIPDLKGRLSLEVKTDHKIGAEQEGDFELETRRLKIDGFEVGSIEASGKGNRERFIFDKLTIQHSGGRATVKNFTTQLRSPYQMTGEVSGDNIEVHSLLKGIKVDKVPVYTTLQPRLKCSAKFKPKANVKCTGRVQADAVKITAGVDSDLLIVGLEDGLVSGDVTVDGQKVTYDAKLSFGNTSGTSKGVIDYDKGFDISYDGTNVDLKDFGEVARIPLEGTGTIKGTTKGNSDTARVDMQVRTEDFYIDDYGLGGFTSKVKYRKGSIYFSDIKGAHRSTQFNGNVTLNLLKERIFVNAVLPFVDLENIQELLERKLKIGTEITGTGNARVVLRGPFDINKVSYEADAQIFRGVIADESYDQIKMKLNSKSGLITAEEFSLTKGSGVMNVRGQGTMGKDINAKVTARGFRIEQSENLSQRNIKLGGLLDFDSSVSGSFQNPTIDGTGELRNVLLGDAPVAGAKFKVGLKEKVFSGNADFGRGVASFDWKLGTEADGVVDVSGKFKDWDFSQAFSIFSDNLRASSYSANVKGGFSFKANKSDLNKADATIDIETLKLKANESELFNTNPMILRMKKGNVNTKNFRLRGSGGYARLVSGQKKGQELDLKLEGRAEMSLLSLLTPFLDDIRGQVNVALAITGTPSDPLFSGNMYMTDAYVRAKAFPHGLEQASADILFDKNKIVLNNVKGRLAGGTANASGQILFNGVKDLPIDINGQFFDSNFLVPAGFNTRGNGSFSLKGNWFPYNLAVNYDVSTGKVDREFKVEESSQKEIRPSAYLPKFLAEKRFSPINLDIRVSLPNELPVKLQVTRLEVDSKINGNIRVLGPPEEPLLDGRIQIVKGGLITFRDNVFEVKSGYVEYRNEVPENPRLNISAESQVRAQIGADADDEKDFDVSLRVLGSASEPQVTVSSQPPLSESELLSLLTLGFISDQGNDVEENENGITDTSYKLGSAFLNEQLGLNRQLGKRLGVQFDFSSAYDSEDSAAVHTFTVKKQWTPKFGTAASRSVGKTNTNRFEAKYRINNNVSVIGNYEGKEQTGANDDDEDEDDDNLFGLDIEYKVEFK